jgi:hypothetical protein
LIPLLNQGLNQVLIQALPGDLRPRCRWSPFTEHLAPQLRRWIEQDFAVLQQPAVLPALGAADAFVALEIDQICGG